MTDIVETDEIDGDREVDLGIDEEVDHLKGIDLEIDLDQDPGIELLAEVITKNLIELTEKDLIIVVSMLTYIIFCWIRPRLVLK